MKVPSPAVVAVKLITPVPPIMGLELALVGEITIPRSVTSAPPSEVTLPPRVAEVEVTFANVGVVIVGGDNVVKVPTVEVWLLPKLLVA